MVVVVAVVVAAFTNATPFSNLNINPLYSMTYLNYTVFNDSVCTAQYTDSVSYKKRSVDAE